MATRKSTTATVYKVTGGAVVLKLKGGSERYLYRGDLVPREGFEDDSLAHAIGLGLVSEIKAPAVAVAVTTTDKNADTAADAE